MRLTSLLVAAAIAATSTIALADQMSASPKPTGTMHSSMKSNSMHSNSMKSNSMHSNSMHNSGSMKSDHMMASPKPSAKP